jgi:hypothetical protein
MMPFFASPPKASTSSLPTAGDLRTVRKPHGPVVVLLLAILGTSAIRLRLLSMPLERDEGEYAYAGQLIIEGHPPYEQLYNMKWPGTYYSYALIESICGHSIEGIRFGVLVVNVAAIVLVFLIARRVLDAGAAAATAVAYAALSISPATRSFAGHATHFVVLCALASILLLQKALEGQRPPLYFLSGVIAGFAPIMKQPGLVFTVFVLAYWGWQAVVGGGSRRQKLAAGAALLAGILSAFAVLFISLWATNTLGTFWLWTMRYASHYGLTMRFSEAFHFFLAIVILVMGEGYLFWLLAGLGILGLGLHPRTRAAAPFLLGLLLSSFLGVLPGEVFRRHYFIVMLPAVALLIGAAVYVVRRRLELRFPTTALVCAIGMILVPLLTAAWRERSFYFQTPPPDACLKIYGTNPFVESLPVAEYIRTHTKPGEPIVVMGSEPQIYFYSRRPSATGHIYVYSLTEDQPYAHQFREQMIREIEATRPKYFVFVNTSNSWFANLHPDRTLINWFFAFRAHNLKVVAIAERTESMRIVFRSDEPDLHASSGASVIITIYECVNLPASS